MADGLAGKRVVVTGSSQGIGREVALRLVAEGASVVVNGSGSTPGALEGVVSEILAVGGRAVACPGSVAEPETAERLVDACVRSFGGLDVLINVAGVAEPPRSSILNIGLEDWRRQIDVHLNGTFYACRAAARLMAGQRSGVIINTSSHGFQGIYGGTGYAAAKGATNSLTYALAKDLAEHGVRVNAVCPGARTRLSTGPEYEESIRTLHARGLLDDAMMKASLNPAGPEFVAALYAYLASDLADGITGKLFSGAGGYVGLFDGPSERPLAFRKVSAGEGWSLDELHAALAKALRPAEAGQSAA